MTTSVRVGLSPLDRDRCDVVLNLPHYSPVTHGMFSFTADIESPASPDSVITAVTPIFGSMHRGAEKLFESRDYRQILMLANRHEWLSPFTGELGIAQLLERELGITVPIAARWIRTLLAEFNRVTSHLAFLAGFPWHSDLSLRLSHAREPWVELLQSYTGSRMHPMVTRIGGLTHAPSPLWYQDALKLLDQTRPVLSEVQRAIVDLPQGMGVISASAVTRFALSGPVARASGVSIDLRAESSLLTYSELSSFQTHVETQGDVSARLRILCAEIETSLNLLTDIIPACLDRNDEEINVLLPKVLRVPEGHYEHRIETPLGVACWYLVSRNDKMPYRLKLRPSSAHTALALSEALVGTTLGNAPYVVASMPFLAGDIDR